MLDVIRYRGKEDVMEPLISVIVPVYKVEKYLRKCVDSIIAQTYKNLEIILVDDGSPDNCGAICDEYEKKDSRIKVIHKENGGLSSARNAGLDIASGEYIGFIDSDDFVSPRMYERMYDAIKRTGADLCKCNLIGFKDGDAVEELAKQRNSVEEKVYCGADIYNKVGLLSAAIKLYKRNLWDELRFPVGKLHEDRFVAYKIYDRCSSVCCIDDILYYYLSRSGSIMHTYNIKRLDDIEAVIETVPIAIRHGAFCRVSSDVYFAMDFLLKSKGKLDFSIEENRTRYQDIEKAFRKFSMGLVSKNIPFKLKGRIVAYNISPKLYWFLSKCKARIKNWKICKKR